MSTTTTTITEQKADDLKISGPESKDTKAEAAQSKETKEAEARPKAVPENVPIPLEELDRKSALIVCPFCHVQGRTTVEYRDSDATCRMAMGCCCALGVLGVWIPFVFHWGADVDHKCSACQTLVVHKDYNRPCDVFRPTAVPDEKAQYVAMPNMEKVPFADEKIVSPPPTPAPAPTKE